MGLQFDMSSGIPEIPDSEKVKLREIANIELAKSKRILLEIAERRLNKDKNVKPEVGSDVIPED